MEDFFFVKKLKDGSFITKGKTRYFAGHRLNQAGQDNHDGIFAEWNWNGRKLLVRNDRYGMQPMFYFHNNNSFCISPSIIPLLECGAPSDLDCAALAVFFRLGWFHGDTTPFTHIRAVPPNAHLSWNGQLILSYNYSFGKPETISRDAAIDKFISLFENAIKRRASAGVPFSLPLSGGRDSRHILFELIKQGYPPDQIVSTKYHTECRKNSDHKIAFYLSKRLGLKYLFAPPISPLHSACRMIRDTNLCSEEGAWLYGMIDLFSEKKIDTIYDGLGGALTGGCLWRPLARKEHIADIRKGNYEKIAGRMLGPPRPSFEQLFEPDIRDSATWEVAKDSIIEELKRFKNATSPMMMYYFWSSNRRELALMPFKAYRVKTVYVPYLDHQLFDFLAGLDPEINLDIDKKFHTETIARAYPEMKHMPYAKKGVHTNTATYFKHFLFYATQAMNHLITRHPLWTIKQLGIVSYWLRGLLSKSYRQQIKWANPTNLLYKFECDRLRGALKKVNRVC